MTTKQFLLAVVCALLWTIGLTQVPAASQEAGHPQLRCDIGPANKTFGQTQWLVYSCDDNQTLVIVTAPGNPAIPFYFVFSPNENGYQISGEGTGQKDATDAVYSELRALSERDITALIQQTKSK